VPRPGVDVGWRRGRMPRPPPAGLRPGAAHGHCLHQSAVAGAFRHTEVEFLRSV